MGNSSDPLGLTGQSKSIGRRVVTAIIGCGVALGIWRYMGDGAAIWDPGWLGNALANMREAMAAVPDLVNKFIGKASDQSFIYDPTKEIHRS